MSPARRSALPAAHAVQFWVARGGRRAGPIDRAQLERRILSRELNARDHLWWEGAAAWVRLGDVPALANLLVLSSPSSTAAASEQADPFAAVPDRTALPHRAAVNDHAAAHRAPSAAARMGPGSADPRQSTRVFMIEAGLGRRRAWKQALVATVLLVVGGACGFGLFALASTKAAVVVTPAPLTPAPQRSALEEEPATERAQIVTPTYHCLAGGCTAEPGPAVKIRRHRASKARRPQARPSTPAPRRVAQAQTSLSDDGSASIASFGGYGKRNIDVGDKPQLRLQVRMEPPRVDGSALNGEVIGEVVRANMEGVRDCVSRARGDVKTHRQVLKVTVGLNGKVRRTDFADRTFALTPLSSCVKKRARRWSFPAHAQETVFELPLILTR